MAAILRNVIKLNGRRNLPIRFLSGNEIKNQSSIKNATAATNASTESPTITLSDSCVKKLEQICKDGSFLRLTVEGGGCSGFQYKFDLDTKMNDDDITFGTEKAKVVTDNVSIEYCNGATVDYHSELIRSGFRIVGNPKAEQGCSCGSSFAIRLD